MSRQAAAALVVVCAALASVGCSQQVHVRTQTPGAKVTIDEQEYGVIDERGITTEIAPGASAVPYTLEKNGKTFRGEILRSETSIPLVILGIGLAACAVPTCAMASCALANPTVVPALFLGFAAGTGAGGFVAAAASPSWFSLPCVATGAATGLAPLLVLPIAHKTPEFVVLGPPWKKKGKTSAPPSDASRDDGGSAEDDVEDDATPSAEADAEEGMAW